MTSEDPGGAVPRRVMVATDGSATAQRAVGWATKYAVSAGAELILVRILVSGIGDSATPAPEEVEKARAGLEDQAAGLGVRARALVKTASDPALAIAEAAEQEEVDVLVVGNVGMRGRKQFLLGNVPNRVSHNAQCTVVIVNTAPAEGSERTPGVSRARAEGEDVSPDDLFARAWYIARILGRAGIDAAWSDRAGGRVDGARRLRATLEELGPTFAKLGQILSTRPDLLPPPFVAELATLQEHVAPLTEAEVVAAMEHELGVPWEDVFRSIQPEPLAAGTIAQVHRATLESGAAVVVKVQRPGAEDEILADLGLLRTFAEKFGARPALARVFDLPAMVEHLTESLSREVDFRREALNMERMRGILEPYSRLDVPRVYQEYSTRRLLVMEEIPGVPLLEAPAGPARREAAAQLLEAYYRQVMGEGFFHADPHPGNLKWWNETIYLLDLGMVGEVDAGLRRLMLLMLFAFKQRDAPFLSDLILLAASAGAAIVENLDGFRQDLAGMIEKYRDVRLQDIELGTVMQEMTLIAGRHNVRLPASLALVGKAFAQMQMVTAALAPDLDPFETAQSFIRRTTVERLWHELDPERLIYSLQKTQLRVETLVERLQVIAGARPGERLQVDVPGTEHVSAAISTGAYQLSLSLAIVGSLLAAGMTAASPRVPRWVPSLAGGVGSALAARLIAYWRRTGV